MSGVSKHVPLHYSEGHPRPYLAVIQNMSAVEVMNVERFGDVRDCRIDILLDRVLDRFEDW